MKEYIVEFNSRCNHWKLLIRTEDITKIEPYLFSTYIIPIDNTILIKLNDDCLDFDAIINL